MSPQAQSLFLIFYKSFEEDILKIIIILLDIFGAAFITNFS